MPSIRLLSLPSLSLVAAVALSGLLGASPPAAATSYSLTISAETLSGEGLGSENFESLLQGGMIGYTHDADAGTETYYLYDPVVAEAGWSVDQWDSTVKVDPFITNNFTVVNNTGATAVFTFAVSTSIPAFNASQIIESNILLQINDDDNAGGASAASTGVAVYRGLVNGSTVLSLLPDPYSISCTDPSDCSPPGVANGQDGDEVISMAFGPVSATEIGIIVRFSLSNGDSASVNSRFEIVPEPGTAALLGLGLLSLAAARRRHA